MKQPMKTDKLNGDLVFNVKLRFNAFGNSDLIK